jgi:hypothetical protein
MDEKQRDITNHMTALQGENEHTVRGYKVRRVSMESLGVLQMVGSPFAGVFSAALAGQEPEPVQPGPLDCAIFAWAHAEDADTVLDVAMDCAPGVAEPAMQAAMRFIRGWSVEEVGAVIRLAKGELDAVQAASYDMAAPELAGGKKKG